MYNVICVKQGNKYGPEYVNRLYSMVHKNMPTSFQFFCYTDDPSGIDKNIITISIDSGLEKWWPKLDLLHIFNKGENIFFDLDVVILNPLERLCSVKTRTVSILYSQWKEGYLAARVEDKFPTLYNSSIMKWSNNQGEKIYNYFNKHREMILFKYKGIDRFLFNEQVSVDLLPTSIAYSYWKGVNYSKDVTSEKLRLDYEVCILNHGKKQHELQTWIKDYWLGQK